MQKIIKKQLKLTTGQYYKVHLNIVNALLPVKLTPKEIDVLAAFMSFTGEMSENPFGTTGRKLVREQLNLSPGGLGNYLKKLLDKGFLSKGIDTYKILSVLMPNKHTQLYQFKLINNGENKEG